MPETASLPGARKVAEATSCDLAVRRPRSRSSWPREGHSASGGSAPAPRVPGRTASTIPAPFRLQSLSGRLRRHDVEHCRVVMNFKASGAAVKQLLTINSLRIQINTARYFGCNPDTLPRSLAAPLLPRQLSSSCCTTTLAKHSPSAHGAKSSPFLLVSLEALRAIF